MRATGYFVNDVLQRRLYLLELMKYIEQSIVEPDLVEPDQKGRTRRWVYVPEKDRYLRVVIEPDGETVHNAMWDRGFTRRRKT